MAKNPKGIRMGPDQNILEDMLSELVSGEAFSKGSFFLSLTFSHSPYSRLFSVWEEYN
jgi:hypothetical protein